MTEETRSGDCKVNFSISYSSSNKPHDHAIDVEILAPSLLAINMLLREINRGSNKRTSDCRLNVVSDFEHKCFNINFEFITDAINAVKPLIEMDGVKTAKEILEWLGIIAGATGISGFSLIKFLQWKKGRNIKSVEKSNNASEDSVNIVVEGDNNAITINRNIYNFSESPKIMKYTRDIFTPIGADSFDTVEFKDSNMHKTIYHLPEIEDIIASCNQVIASNDNDESEIEEITAWLSIYSPVFDERAEKWRFIYGREHIYVDISETNIAKDAMERGGSSINDSYQVIIEITTPIKKSKSTKQTYKIKRVIKFIPGTPEIQGTLF